MKINETHFGSASRFCDQFWYFGSQLSNLVGVRLSTLPASYWWGVYLWTALLSTAIVSVLGIVVAATLKKHGRNVLMFSQMFFSFVALSVISVLGGTSGPDALASWYPLADIDAKFFSELQILRFIPLCATSVAIVSGLLLRLAAGGPTDSRSVRMSGS